MRALFLALLSPVLCAGPANPAPLPASSVPSFRFAWRPPHAEAAAYEARELADGHRVSFTRGVAPGGTYPVVIALHGQPRRGQAPRDYKFMARVQQVADTLAERGEVRPFVLVLPAFRFYGKNWPNFDLLAFQPELAERLAERKITAGDYYVVGHSGAAGCGGDGLNRAHRIHPAAVGFFDTCVAAGFRNEVLALSRAQIPTLVVHSVETAGFSPRQPREYMPDFDFGRVYRTIGLSASDCPPVLPEAPLRAQPYRCAANDTGTTRAFVIDTGDGEEAHNAVVPVALAYFLQTYLARPAR